jgi:phage-related protein
MRGVLLTVQKGSVRGSYSLLDRLSRIRDNLNVKHVEIHKKAREVIRGFSKQVRAEFGSSLLKLQMGLKLDLPDSKPMPQVCVGAYELRFRDQSGIQRIFYYLKSEKGILIFHAFIKKTQKTPSHEIEIGRRRLEEMIQNG